MNIYSQLGQAGFCNMVHQSRPYGERQMPYIQYYSIVVQYIPTYVDPTVSCRCRSDRCYRQTHVRVSTGSKIIYCVVMTTTWQAMASTEVSHVLAHQQYLYWVQLYTSTNNTSIMYLRSFYIFFFKLKMLQVFCRRPSFGGMNLDVWYDGTINAIPVSEKYIVSHRHNL